MRERRIGHDHPVPGTGRDDDLLEQVLGAVGPRLRAARRVAGLTLDAAGAATGVSASTLSRLESGRRRPTLELLLPLSRLYGLPLDDLVGAPPVGDPRVNLRPVHRGDLTYVPLTQLPGPQHAVKIVIGTSHSLPRLRSHEGVEWLYVLAGRLRLVVGEHDVVMTSGQAAEFDTRTPHWFGSTGEAPVEVLSLLGLQGRRIHLTEPDVRSARGDAPEGAAGCPDAQPVDRVRPQAAQPGGSRIRGSARRRPQTEGRLHDEPGSGEGAEPDRHGGC